jgi:hypothetical protein
VNMCGLILLSNGRLDANRQNQKNKQCETEHARTETVHGQPPGTVPKYRARESRNQ